jgi:hypothetical protein
VAVADDGSIYLAGTTCSSDFPVFNAQQPTQTRPGANDGYLVKFTSEFGRVFATYFGGSNTDDVYRLTLDPDGNPYLLGCSFRVLGDSWSLPLTPGAFQMDSDSAPNFVAKFDPSGALIYSTFLGPMSGADSFQCSNRGDIAVDVSGNAYVVGVTGSSSFPTTPGAFQPAHNGFGDLFVSKLATDGSSLVYSTYLGGTRAEQHNSGAQGVRIALDDDGNAFVTTATFSNDLPVQTPLQSGTTGDFVAGFNSSGSGLVFSTYVPIGVGPLALMPGAIYLAGYNPNQQGLLAIKLTAGAATCIGDCSGDGRVTVDEIVRGVNIALGTLLVGDCPSLDTDGSGTVTVDELIRALTNALGGCA